MRDNIFLSLCDFRLSHCGKRFFNRNCKHEHDRCVTSKMKCFLFSCKNFNRISSSFLVFCTHLFIPFVPLYLFQVIKLAHCSVVCILLSARADKHIMKEKVNLLLILSLTLFAAIMHIHPANGQGMVPVFFFFF